MSDVCREFGISRKTGYKIYSRYREHGLFALTDRSRRRVRYAKRGHANNSSRAGIDSFRTVVCRARSAARDPL
jgi:hypothetical protein